MLIEANKLSKKYPMGMRYVEALKGIDFSAEDGEFVSIMGPSGSGKSTLLHILGCLDRPTSGFYRLSGIDILSASDRTLSHIRANRIGFVFQTFNLVSTLSVCENVELPLFYSDQPEIAKRQRVTAAIERVGLRHRTKHRPSELSGGEMQRVAIARAMAIKPALILADEPTGNLDTKTGEEILDLFSEMNADGVTIVMVTHNTKVAGRAHRNILLEDGAIDSKYN